ncbi:putative Late nodulin [Medicago truncatula]|uniref:Nodule Cysteine-Rich (NCR) secreted peptide n=1 Tax=Medicago truncatula TaxID=3880 RepID=G7K1L6_MEDTR|nr:Nodule Cysteine-Rich (NCR) secreted peptide [Medicago truncatula]RHN55917.1 putative Late nodulin [Medicago truncatula]
MTNYIVIFFLALFLIVIDVSAILECIFDIDCPTKKCAPPLVAKCDMYECYCRCPPNN